MSCGSRRRCSVRAASGVDIQVVSWLKSVPQCRKNHRASSAPLCQGDSGVLAVVMRVRSEGMLRQRIVSIYGHTWVSDNSTVNSYPHVIPGWSAGWPMGFTSRIRSANIKSRYRRRIARSEISSWASSRYTYPTTLLLSPCTELPSSRSRPGSGYHLSPGTRYALLHALEADGLLAREDRVVRG